MDGLFTNKPLYDNLFNVDKVNIDYSNFSNFVKYSSAVERLANFKYKKELLEYYDDRVHHLQIFTGSVSAVNEILSYETKKVNLESYVKKYLRDYNQYGFDVSGLQSMRENKSVIVDINQKNKKGLSVIEI